MTDTTIGAEKEKREVPLVMRVFFGILASGTTSFTLTWCSLHGIDFETLGINSEAIKSGITGALTGIFVAPECIPIAIAAFIFSCRMAKRTIARGFTKPLPNEDKP